MFKMFSNIRIRCHFEVIGRIAIFLIFLLGHLSGQSSTIKTLYCVYNRCDDTGGYNYTTKSYSHAGGTGGFRITFASFKTSGSPDYKIKYRINSGVITNLVGGTTTSASMTVDILDSALPTISAGEKIIFFAVSDFGGDGATVTTCQADGDGYYAISNSAGDKDYFFYDVGRPYIENVTSSTGNGTKKIGDEVSIQVTFNEDVIVSGTPTLTLETGDTDAVVDFVSEASGVLTFTYTVASGHESLNLAYKATTSLTAGTYIRDAAGNDAVLTLPTPGNQYSLSNNKNLVIDGVLPNVSQVLGEGLIFTNASITGRTGPTQAQINTAYNNTNLDDAVTINTQGIQEWTVPATGTYTIEVWGASGGASTGSGEHAAAGQWGLGARMKGDFSLTEDDVLLILVGQQGGNTSTHGGGGGGGTFVTTGSEYSSATPLIIAGGGGGGGRNYSTADGRTSESGRIGGKSSGGSNNRGAGGTSGSGATTNDTSATYGGNGGGFLTSGTGSYDYNEVIRIFNDIPKFELFRTTKEDLLESNIYRKRLAYDELLAHQLAIAIIRNYNQKTKGIEFKKLFSEDLFLNPKLVILPRPNSVDIFR